MDWLLVATAVMLVTAVGSVDDEKNNTLCVSVNSVHSCQAHQLVKTCVLLFYWALADHV